MPDMRHILFVQIYYFYMNNEKYAEMIMILYHRYAVISAHFPHSWTFVRGI